MRRRHPDVHLAPERGYGHVDDRGVKDDRHAADEQDDGQFDQTAVEALVCRCLCHEL